VHVSWVLRDCFLSKSNSPFEKLFLCISFSRRSASWRWRSPIANLDVTAPPNEGFAIGQGEPTVAVPSSPLLSWFYVARILMSIF